MITLMPKQLTQSTSEAIAYSMFKWLVKQII